jgi:glycosyltransferase involved in cell wall biosynthesis
MINDNDLLKSIKGTLISVIIPVYKAEAYIERCLDSVLAQTHREIEVILVDDGSPDNSGAICDTYAQKDMRIKVIHKENGGASSAKNAALEIATGEYIGFVDSDDHIHPQMYELLLYYAVRDNSDMVSTERNPKIAKDVFDPIVDGEGRLVVTADEVLERFHQEYYARLWMSYQIKLFRREVFEGHRFREGIIYEDTDLFPETIRRCNRITIVPLLLYYYTLSDNSVMRAHFSYKRYMILEVWQRYILFFQQLNLEESRDYYAVVYLYSLVSLYRTTVLEHPELMTALKPYIDAFLQFRPVIRKGCKLSRLQRLLLEIFPMMPKTAMKLHRLLNR